MPMQILNSIISETTKFILGRKWKLVANFNVGPASKQTNKQTWKKKKYQMKSHPALNIELKKKKKKLVKLKKEVEKKCRKLLID